MRRLDLHPLRKLRNPGRHLRSLARWPKRIVTHLPTPADLEAMRLTGRGFWNFKVGAFEKLVSPPHATPDTQRACLATIFAAAEAIERAPNRPVDCRIACLVTTPFLFESEVTIFSDEDYFRSFLPVPERKRTTFEGGWIEGEPADAPVLEPILPPAPAGLDFMGGTLLREYDPERAAVPFERINWVWAYPRR